MVKQAHLYIKGDVIGVGFRAWTKIQAKTVGVNGWVRNLNDRVEAIIQGDEENVKKAVSLIRRGPPVSHVENVEIFFEKPKEIFEGFEIRK